MTDAPWLSVPEVAALARISVRAATAAVARCAKGEAWRGHMLIVRRMLGSRGRGGLRYEVNVDSLPAELVERYASTHAPAEAVSAPQRLAPSAELPASLEWQRRYELIRPALATARGSNERAEMIAGMAARNGVSERTIRKYLAAYETAGSLHGLTRRRRQDQGKRRVFVSRVWDRAMSFDEATRRDIAGRIERYVRSVWAADRVSWRRVQQLATKELVKLSRRAGCELPDAELIPLCTLPKNAIEAHRSYSVLAVQRKDAKLFADKHLPRIRRDRSGMLPMQMVVGDVHPIDILVCRPDGSTCTPRGIAWHDVATNRVFMTVVILEKGKGIRQEHVIGSFIEMTQHREWGMPAALYLDNGGEYNWSGFVDDAMRLAGLPIRFLSDDTEARDSIAAARRSMTVRARPYNAPAKPVEGTFSNLEGGFFCLIPGWIGGDRMRQKTANVGRAPVPFRGDAAAIDGAIQSAIAAYDVTPQSGHLAGKSPRQAFAEHVASGWRRTDIDRHALEAVFAREVLRHVRRGEITVEGRAYTDRALDQLTGQRVRVRVPLVGERHRITVLDDRGGVFCVAEPSPLYPFLGSAGPKAQASRAADLHRALVRKRAEVEPLDLAAEMGEFVALQPPAPMPESAGTIRLSDEMHAIAEAHRRLPTSEAPAPVNEGAELWRRLGSRSRKSSAGSQ